jgi:glycosyltransferase involved in cell wall biosynthesis
MAPYPQRSSDVRIVMAANWWYRRGGLGAVMLDEAGELGRRGHEVIPFASRHPENLDSPWSGYFPEFREIAGVGGSMSVGRQISTALRLIRNREAAGQFARLLRDTRPDVVHLHSAARQLSPAILAEARRLRIPVVMTQHDYQVVCPQGYLLKGDREACTRPNCVRGNPVHVVTQRCVRGKLLPSAVAAVEYGVNRTRGAYAGRVELMLAPSRFMAEMLTDAGFPANLIRHLANGIEPGDDAPDLPKTGGYFLYAGRLSREKGIDLLIEALRHVPGVPVLIAGDGPSRAALESAAPESVRFVGHVSTAELRHLRAEAVAVISPSIWYENAPISVLEAMRDARPTIVSAIGGQPELVEGDCGLIVPMGDVHALGRAMSQLWNDRPMAARMGRSGRARLLASYTLADHVSGLEAIYAEVSVMAGSRPGPDRHAGPRATASSD